MNRRAPGRSSGTLGGSRVTTAQKRWVRSAGTKAAQPCAASPCRTCELRHKPGTVIARLSRNHLPWPSGTRACAIRTRASPKDPSGDHGGAPRPRNGALRCRFTTRRTGCAPQITARAWWRLSGVARRLLPGDPEFGDPLSTAGEGGPRAAARAADRLLGDRDAASREVSLGVLQVWQAMTEAVSRRPANPEVTLVFTDLVGFSTWSLQAGDDAALDPAAAGGAGRRAAAARRGWAHRQTDGRRNHGGLPQSDGRRAGRTGRQGGAEIG